MGMGTGNAFLLFAYFGIDDACCVRCLFRNAVLCAYRDAASHVLSVAESEKAARKRKAVQRISERLRQFLLGGEGQDYHAFHEQLCRELVEEIYHGVAYQAETRRFTYGIAQKWVNMTVKYLWLLADLLPRDSEFVQQYGASLKAYETVFHVPLDRYMLNAVKKELHIDHRRYGFDTWSSIGDYPGYQRYQQEILKALGTQIPAEWENRMWIRYARKG